MTATGWALGVMREQPEPVVHQRLAEVRNHCGAAQFRRESTANPWSIAPRAVGDLLLAHMLEGCSRASAADRVATFLLLLGPGRQLPQPAFDLPALRRDKRGPPLPTAGDGRCHSLSARDLVLLPPAFVLLGKPS